MKHLTYTRMAHGRIIGAIAMLVVSLSGTYATAAPIAVANHSFESPNSPAYPIPPNNWTNSGTAGSAVGAGNGFSNFNIPGTNPEDGSRYAFFNTFAANDTASLTSDAIPDADPFSAGTTIAANTKYTLTVAVGLRENSGLNPSDEYLIELLSDGSPFASQGLSDASTVITPGTFQDLILMYTTGASGGPVGGVLSIRLTHTNDGTDVFDEQGQMDNVRLEAEQVTSVVPTPAALPAGLALLGLAAGRRRRT